MYVCMCVCMCECVCAHACMHVCVCVHVCDCTCACMRSWMNVIVYLEFKIYVKVLFTKCLIPGPVDNTAAAILPSPVE